MGVMQAQRVGETAEAAPLAMDADGALHAWEPHPELPAWYNAFRAAAHEVYLDNELPGYGNEAWHYGDPKKFTLEGLAPAPLVWQPGGRAGALLAIAQSDDSATVAEWHGLLELASINEKDNKAGVRLAQLSDLARERRLHKLPEFWTERAPQLYGNKLAGAHYALGADPIVIQLPRGYAADGPIVIVLDAGPAAQVVAPQVLIHAEAGSQAEIVLGVSTSTADQRQLILASTRVFLERDAHVKVSRVQHLGDRTDSLTWESVDAATGSQYNSVNLLFGGRNVRLEAVADLREPHSTVHLYGGCVARGRERYDFLTHQNHLAPHANSNLLYKSALLQRSRVSYQGTITVHPGAQKTDAYQKNRSLVLSPQARSDSSPQLEIKADDVRCSHGSTTSNVSAAELFYLRSRGIKPEAARQLLVEGFLGEISTQITSPPLRDYVTARVLEQL
jgi:Fe-S cluster assembly protein SufD